MSGNIPSPPIKECVQCGKKDFCYRVRMAAYGFEYYYCADCVREQELSKQLVDPVIYNLMESNNG